MLSTASRIWTGVLAGVCFFGMVWCSMLLEWISIRNFIFILFVACATMFLCAVYYLSDWTIRKATKSTSRKHPDQQQGEGKEDDWKDLERSVDLYMRRICQFCGKQASSRTSIYCPECGSEYCVLDGSHPLVRSKGEMDD